MKALNELLVLDEQGRTWVDLGLLAEQSGVSLSRLKRSAWRAADLQLSVTATRINRPIVLRRDIEIALTFLKLDEPALLLRQHCHQALRAGSAGKKLGRTRKLTEVEAEVKEALRNGTSKRSLAKKYSVQRATINNMLKRGSELG